MIKCPKCKSTDIYTKGLATISCIVNVNTHRVDSVDEYDCAEWDGDMDQDEKLTCDNCEYQWYYGLRVFVDRWGD